MPTPRRALQFLNSLESHTFGVLKRRDLFELVDGNLDLTPEVRILAAPGESPGHQIVRGTFTGTNPLLPW